nr:MAG TPA: hypothetical protein [Caudoviricetes sp.]DAV67114.1 MAG TPA: hypothetical protein [Caudoviricetes sp.]DAV74880.1 MAG TPA: hypothetical protein [Caudoviricetes sp.]
MRVLLIFKILEMKSRLLRRQTLLPKRLINMEIYL